MWRITCNNDTIWGTETSDLIDALVQFNVETGLRKRDIKTIKNLNDLVAVEEKVVNPKSMGDTLQEALDRLDPVLKYAVIYKDSVFLCNDEKMVKNTVKYALSNKHILSTIQVIYAESGIEFLTMENKLTLSHGEKKVEKKQRKIIVRLHHMNKSDQKTFDVYETALRDRDSLSEAIVKHFEKVDPEYIRNNVFSRIKLVEMPHLNFSNPGEKYVFYSTVLEVDTNNFIKNEE